MEKLRYHLLANLIFLLHTVIVSIIVIGWYYPAFQTLNLFVTMLTLFIEISFGYCPLTKWEFSVRKKLEPNLNYDAGFITYYAYKIFDLDVPTERIKYPAIIVLIFVLILNLLVR